MAISSTDDTVYWIALIYEVSPEICLIQSDETRENDSETFPLHALTRTGLRERPEWTYFKQTCLARIKERSGEDLPGVLRSRMHDLQPPCVMVRHADGMYRTILDGDDLKACRGNLDLFLRRLKQALWLNGLRFPTNGTGLSSLRKA